MVIDSNFRSAGPFYSYFELYYTSDTDIQDKRTISDISTFAKEIYVKPIYSLKTFCSRKVSVLNESEFAIRSKDIICRNCSKGKSELDGICQIIITEPYFRGSLLSESLIVKLMAVLN